MINPPMIYSGAGLQLTERAEGFSLTSYQDSDGVWSCGYGHIDGVGPSTICTPELALQWIEQDTQWASNAVNNLVNVQLTQNEFDALVDFVFNIGAHAFEQSTLLILLNQGDFVNASLQFQRWDLCDGKVVAGLLNRRTMESNEFNGTDSP